VRKFAPRLEHLVKFVGKRGTLVFVDFRSLLIGNALSLPIPSRDEILSSPIQEHGPHHGATSSFTASQGGRRPPSPVMDDPSEELERELAGTHLGARRG
jgi:hypothetical protein